MALPILLRELKERTYFLLNSNTYRLLSFEMEGVRCEDKDGKLYYFSYLEIVTLPELPF